MRILYIEREHIGTYKAVDRLKLINAQNYFVSGGLIYAKVNDFEYKTIESDLIVFIDGVLGAYVTRHASPILSDIFEKLTAYLVFDGDFTKEQYNNEFLTDIYAHDGRETLQTIETLLNNNELLCFPFFDELTDLKNAVKRYTNNYCFY